MGRHHRWFLSFAISVSTGFTGETVLAEDDDWLRRREGQAETFFEEVLHREPRPEQILQTVEYLRKVGTPSQDPKVLKSQIKGFFEEVLDRPPSHSEVDRTEHFLEKQRAADKKWNEQTQEKSPSFPRSDDGIANPGPQISFGGLRRNSSKGFYPSDGYPSRPSDSLYYPNQSAHLERVPETSVAAPAPPVIPMPPALSEASVTANLPMARRELAAQVQKGALSPDEADRVLKALSPALEKFSEVEGNDDKIRKLLASAIPRVAGTAAKSAPAAEAPVTPTAVSRSLPVAWPSTAALAVPAIASRARATMTSMPTIPMFIPLLAPISPTTVAKKDSEVSDLVDKNQTRRSGLRKQTEVTAGIGGEAVLNEAPPPADRDFPASAGQPALRDKWVLNRPALNPVSLAERMRAFIGKAVTDYQTLKAARSPERRLASEGNSALAVPRLDPHAVGMAYMAWPTRATAGETELAEPPANWKSRWPTAKWAFAAVFFFLLMKTWAGEFMARRR